MSEAKLNTQLKKPTAFIKVQTTGTKVEEGKIVELAITKIGVDGKITQGVRRFNPLIPIPAEATEIHGITDADVADKPKFKESAQGLFAFINDCDIVGFGITFDLKFLIEEFGRAGISFTTYGRNVVDLMRAWHKMEPRDFLSGYLRFTGKNVEEGFDLTAKAQTEMATEIFNGLTSEFSGKEFGGSKIDNDIQNLANTFKDDKEAIDLEGRLVKTDTGVKFAFGKHDGKLVTDVMSEDLGYIQWILEGANSISYEVKAILKSLKEREDAKVKEVKAEHTV